MTTEPPWLAEPLRRLEGLAERLPHAILIQGPGGWGEERLANALATSLLSLPPEREAKEVAHPDLRSPPKTT